MLTALSQINIELTSRCDKSVYCAMCGHQNAETNKSLKYGDMDFALLESIREQLSPPTIIGLHRDGDPLAFERLGDALKLFDGFPVSIVTHGEALNKRAYEIIDNATTVTVSVIPKDPDRAMQLESVSGFLAKKGNRRPMVQLKFVGHIDDAKDYEALGVPIINRALHSSKGNWSYRRADPPVPEVRVCLELLGHPAIDWQGHVFACNRLAPNGEGKIGDLNTQSLDEVWNGAARAEMLRHHLAGRRDLAGGLCGKCEFWGIPTPSG